MALRTRSYKIGTQAIVFPEDASFTLDHTGATVAATPAGRYAKPGAAQTTGWEGLGVIEEAEDQPSFGELTKIYAPTPGKSRLYEVIAGQAEMMTKLTLVEVTPVAVRAWHLTQALTAASTSMNVLETDLFHAWLKLQSYDQKDREWIHHDIWGVFVPNNTVKRNGKEIVKLGFDVFWLHSPLQASSLAMP